MIMFKTRVLLAGMLCAGICFANMGTSAQTDFDAFWAKFKTAVVNKDKTAVASMTKFPLDMPFGMKTIRTRAEFLKKYADIMNMEANAARCFQATKPTKDDKAWAVWCTFKSEPESSDNRPIEYYFVKTKTGWKFAGIDNINE
jgi:hypothetical protein